MEDAQQTRLGFFEMMLFWQQHCSTKQMMTQFSLTRAQVGKDIARYREHYPSTLVSNKSPFTVAADFTPHCYQGGQIGYLHWLETGQFVAELPAAPDWLLATKLYRPQLNPRTLWPIVQALQSKQRVEVDYVSLNNPDSTGRIIQPHALVKTGQRYHLRAYCEKSKGFRDFVLTRFRGEPQLEGPATHFAQDDIAFNTDVTLELIPDTRLTSEQQQVVAHDYQMTNNRLHITTKAALAHYVLLDLGINHKMLHAEPKAQQIILANKPALKPWLMDD